MRNMDPGASTTGEWLIHLGKWLNQIQDNTQYYATD